MLEEKNDSMVVIHSPTELYDRYGRRVKISSEISCILCRYDSKSIGGSIDDTKELFLARKTNGKMVLAEFNAHGAYDKDHERGSRIMPFFRAIYRMCSEPTITPRKYEFDRIDNSVFETTTMQAFLSNFPAFHDTPKIDYFTGVNGPSLPSDNCSLFRNNCFYVGTWMHNNFADSREAIMSSTEDREPQHDCANYMLGNIVVSEDGAKLSAICPRGIYKDEKLFYKTISTDLEVVKHMWRKYGQASLWWYYDGGEVAAPVTP